MKKLSLRDQLAANQKALEGLCRMAGKEAPAPAYVMAPKRERAAPKPSGIPTEHQEQVAFVKWFRMQYRDIKIFAIPNAAIRTPQLAAYLKAEGMSAGVPDLCIPAWHTWIEFKRVKKGVISEEQQDWHDYLRGIGDRVIVARGCEDAMRQISAV